LSKNRQRQEALPGTRAELKLEVKALKWRTDVASVFPATKSVVATQDTHARPSRSVCEGR
jgi:hypothetical protein